MDPPLFFTFSSLSAAIFALSPRSFLEDDWRHWGYNLRYMMIFRKPHRLEVKPKKPKIFGLRQISRRLKSVLSDLFWRHLATKLWARSSRSMAENGASRRGYKFDPVKILPKPHRFGVAPPRRSVRITLDFRKIALTDLLWRPLAAVIIARSSRSIAENAASKRGFNFDPVKIFPKPHRFRVISPQAPRILRPGNRRSRRTFSIFRRVQVLKQLSFDSIVPVKYLNG